MAHNSTNNWILALFPVHLEIANNEKLNATTFNRNAHTVGRLPCGKLQTVHLDLVRADIFYCGGAVDHKMGIRRLGNCLLEFELEFQSKIYKERTGNDARDEDLNHNTFKHHHGKS